MCHTAFINNNEKNAGSTSSFAALSIQDDLINWATQFQISHVAVIALLSILRKHGLDLSRNSKTLLKTPRYTNIRRVEPGEYFHNGLKSGIMTFLQKKV